MHYVTLVLDLGDRHVSYLRHEKYSTRAPSLKVEAMVSETCSTVKARDEDTEA